MLRRSTIAGILVLALFASAPAALALAQFFSGSTVVAVRAMTENTDVSTNSQAWVNIPNATLPVSVGADGALLLARFSGESRCVNTQAAGLNHCRVRIVLQTPAGALVEFNPQSGTDAWFDNTVDGRGKEAHGIERLLKVGGGQYRVLAQYSTTDPVTLHTLDDFAFVVEVIQP